MKYEPQFKQGYIVLYENQYGEVRPLLLEAVNTRDDVLSVLSLRNISWNKVISIEKIAHLQIRERKRRDG